MIPSHDELPMPMMIIMNHDIATDARARTLR